MCFISMELGGIYCTYSGSIYTNTGALRLDLVRWTRCRLIWDPTMGTQFFPRCFTQRPFGTFCKQKTISSSKSLTTLSMFTSFCVNIVYSKWAKMAYKREPHFGCIMVNLRKFKTQNFLPFIVFPAMDPQAVIG